MFQSRHERFDDISRHPHDGLARGEREGRRSAERLRDRAADWRDEAAPAVSRLSERAEDLARGGAQWMREGGDRMRYRMARASDRTVDYVRDEPVRSMVVAAAAGALLFALVRMIGSRTLR